jgi:hypothetical protein
VIDFLKAKNGQMLDFKPKSARFVNDYLLLYVLFETNFGF